MLEKETVRRGPLSLVADDCSARRMIRVHTSGTTGTPLEVYRSRATEMAWYAMFEVRVRQRWGLRWSDRWVHLGGRLVREAAATEPPFWVHNRGLHQLYMSSYHLSPSHAASYLEAISRFGARSFVGYTSSLATLAQFQLELRIEGIEPRVVIANAEPVYRHQRDVIERAFGCPLVETYGMAELAVAAARCTEGNLHLWPDVGRVEILSDAGHPAAPGEIGHLVATGLLNPDQPLIRYRTGDLAAAPEDDFFCPCGDPTPILLSLEGRADDVLVTSEGRRVGRLDPVFKMGVHIREAQIVQRRLDRFAIRYVSAPGFTASEGEHMVQALRDRVGPYPVDLEPVAKIARTRAGKFRAVVSEVGGEGEGT